MGVEVTLYDVLLDETGRQYAVGHVAAVKSSFSTTIKVGLWHETDSTGVRVLKLEHDNQIYPQIVKMCCD